MKTTGSSPKIPKEFQKRSKAIYMILFGIPLTLVTSYPLYTRIVSGEERKEQQGEFLPNGQIKVFDEYEKKEHEKSSWFNTLFGSK